MPVRYYAVEKRLRHWILVAWIVGIVGWSLFTVSIFRKIIFEFKVKSVKPTLYFEQNPNGYYIPVEPIEGPPIRRDTV